MNINNMPKVNLHLAPEALDPVQQHKAELLRLFDDVNEGLANLNGYAGDNVHKWTADVGDLLQRDFVSVEDELMVKLNAIYGSVSRASREQSNEAEFYGGEFTECDNYAAVLNPLEQMITLGLKL